MEIVAYILLGVFAIFLCALPGLLLGALNDITEEDFGHNNF